MSRYLKHADQNMGYSPSHMWAKNCTTFIGWYVCALDAFCVSGFAVVDDFGNLVKVPA